MGIRCFMAWGLVCTAAATMVFDPAEARACGGCFHPENQTPEQASVVTAHRMALSISSSQTVLWDQVRYSGAPADFAWVLPVRAGAYVEVSNDAWFETLDAATTVRINPPTLACNSGGSGAPIGCGMPIGCSSDEEAGRYGVNDVKTPEPDPVTVVHEGSAGPYETVTLRSTTAGALSTWLLEHGYAIAADIQPVIDAYEAEGFDFIALRLSPGAGVQQMRPVRVVEPGAVPSLPLRMVAAGTGARVGITLFVIGEGRWTTNNFPAVAVPLGTLTWDFTQSSSNYSQLRQQALGQYAGWAWISPYAEPQGLLVAQPNPLGGNVQYVVGSEITTTIADAYVRQGLIDFEATDTSCVGALAAIATSEAVVVDPCPADGSPCTTVGGGQIDARSLACGSLDDLSVALVGMHPADVWLTRLEADLPRAALAQDLQIQAASDQSASTNWLVATNAVSEPCPLASAAPPLDEQRPKNRDIALTMAALASAIAALRRATRIRGSATAYPRTAPARVEG